MDLLWRLAMMTIDIPRALHICPLCHEQLVTGTDPRGYPRVCGRCALRVVVAKFSNDAKAEAAEPEAQADESVPVPATWLPRACADFWLAVAVWMLAEILR
jgi:hypothetical protein